MLVSLQLAAPALYPQDGAAQLMEEVFDAAFQGQWLPIQQAIEKGYQPDQADPGGRTALMLAAFNGHTQVVARLIAAGANPNATDQGGSTALMFASSGPFVETVEVLLQSGAQINTVDGNEHFSALMWAAAEGQFQVVKVLLKHNADTSLQDIDGDTAESFARKAGHTAVADLIRETSASLAPAAPEEDPKGNHTEG